MKWVESPDYKEIDGKLICVGCGKERRMGEWAWCPHGFGNGGLDPMEPYVDSDLLDRKDPRVALGGYKNEYGRPGVLIETRSDRKKLMREKGLHFGSNHPGGREV